MKKQETINFIQELAQTSGEIIRKYFRNPLDVDAKPDRTPVTIADRQSELIMRKLISQRYPSHGILGEEFGATNGSRTQYCWVIDPLDEPLIGVIHFPVTNETVYAGKGLGCWKTI